MSDIDRFKIADAMNYVDPDYVTEYEGLSTYVTAKRIIRRRRVRIISRVAACVAIVGTGVFLTVHDINNGLIGGHTKGIEYSSDNYGYMEDSQDVSGKGNYDTAQYTVSWNTVECEAPSTDIQVTLTAVSDTYLSLEYTLSSNEKWYTGDAIDIYSIEDDGSEKALNSYSADLFVRMAPDENGCYTYRYSWADIIGQLEAGNYRIVVYISDGNVSYAVKTKITVISL